MVGKLSTKLGVGGLRGVVRGESRGLMGDFWGLGRLCVRGGRRGDFLGR